MQSSVKEGTLVSTGACANQGLCKRQCTPTIIIEFNIGTVCRGMGQEVGNHREFGMPSKHWAGSTTPRFKGATLRGAEAFGRVKRSRAAPITFGLTLPFPTGTSHGKLRSQRGSPQGDRWKGGGCWRWAWQVSSLGLYPAGTKGKNCQGSLPEKSDIGFELEDEFR